MDTIMFFIIAGASAIGFYLAWSIGANDVSNAMATAVGARAITYKQAALIAGILIFFGAIFVGPHVAETIKSKIVNTSEIKDPTFLLLGFVSSILAASIWSTLATWKEMPISTTHSIVGSLLGFGLVAGGISSINWVEVGRVALSWVLSPIGGCVIAFIVFRVIVKLIFAQEHPVRATKIVGPLIMGVTAFVLSTSLFFKTQLGILLGIADLLMSILISLAIALIIILLSYYLLRNVQEKTQDDYATVEGIFRKLQIITSCYVAFSIGSNDVANAIGPIAAIVPLASDGTIGTVAEIPVYLLLIGASGMALGCLIWGYRVMKTMGSRITKLTNTRGFSVDFGGATTVLIASKLGLPISTSHTAVGAIIGVGLARGLEAIDLKVIRKIVISWLLTLPIAATTSAIIFIGLITLI